MIYGAGMEWRRDRLRPLPPHSEFATDVSHSRYLDLLEEKMATGLREAGIAALSWPSGVTFGTFAVQPLDGVDRYTQRKVNAVPTPTWMRTGGWAERQVVGVQDFIRLCASWRMRAAIVQLPLFLYDGASRLAGPDNSWFLPSGRFGETDRDRLMSYWLRCYGAMAKAPGFADLERVYVCLGHEWCPRWVSIFRGVGDAARSYAELGARFAEQLSGEKRATVVLSGAMKQEWEPLAANAWHKPLFEVAGEVPNVAVNVDKYMTEFWASRAIFRVGPENWGENGLPFRSVCLEASIHSEGHDKDAEAETFEWPESGVAAFKAMRAKAETDGCELFLAWQWNPESRPAPYPYGMIDERGEPTARALALRPEVG